MFKVLGWLMCGLIGGTLQAQGVGGRGGGGLISDVRHEGCREGTRAMMEVKVRFSDETRWEVRECRNGSYVDLSDYIYEPRRGCHREGRVEMWTEYDGDKEYFRYMQCQQGRWVEVTY